MTGSLNVIGPDRRARPDQANWVFPTWSDGDQLVVSNREEGRCYSLPRDLLKDPSFDLYHWYEEAAIDLCNPPDSEAWLHTDSDLELPSSGEDSMPDLELGTSELALCVRLVRQRF
ncbi:hypothetical protein B0H17DRAFT_1145401 [Mycena rosella]|uniref:Uncharacterized protein n=1 Tax=Mycena rosella TaxID=1033263 RepID=A0AAD7CR43_MYCRO|nr:hypothetical protein B0H17DRAFT_1145401 [Mycena rosella]